jgi:hypothetical protein
MSDREWPTVLVMPIVEVALGSRVDESAIARLQAVLPEIVSIAVECPEEPYDGELRPGDMEIRFRPLGRDDLTGLDVLIEVRSTWFASRADNRQERADRLCAGVAESLPGLTLGVFMTLPVAAWSQTD